MGWHSSGLPTNQLQGCEGQVKTTKQVQVGIGEAERVTEWHRNRRSKAHLDDFDPPGS